MRSNIKGIRLAWLLAFVYFASYSTRINFAAVIQAIATDTSYAKSALSVILVCMSISYALGQIINGKLGDTILPQDLIFLGLIIATAMNLLLPFCAFSIPLMALLWTVNGFAQAMMWPPMVKIMVDTLDELTYGKAVIIVSAGSSVGTVFVYLFSSFLLTFTTWKAIFFTSATIGIFTVILWGICRSRVYDGVTHGDAPRIESSMKEATPHTPLVPKAARLPLLFIMLAIIFQGMLRDSVTSWMPSYLSEVFRFSDSASILCTVILAIFSLLTFIVVGAIYQNFFKNEVACAAAIYGVGTLCAALLFVFFNAGAVLAILMLTLLTAAVHGVNLMLITHVPKRFRKYGNISTLSGILNSFTYVGSSIATYGIARFAELFGWHMTTGVWLGIAVLGLVSCLIAMPKWKIFMKQ